MPPSVKPLIMSPERPKLKVDPGGTMTQTRDPDQASLTDVADSRQSGRTRAIIKMKISSRCIQNRHRFLSGLDRQRTMDVPKIRKQVEQVSWCSFMFFRLPNFNKGIQKRFLKIRFNAYQLHLHSPSLLLSQPNALLPVNGQIILQVTEWMATVLNARLMLYIVLLL